MPGPRHSASLPAATGRHLLAEIAASFAHIHPQTLSPMFTAALSKTEETKIRNKKLCWRLCHATVFFLRSLTCAVSQLCISFVSSLKHLQFLNHSLLGKKIWQWGTVEVTHYCRLGAGRRRLGYGRERMLQGKQKSYKKICFLEFFFNVSEE